MNLMRIDVQDGRGMIEVVVDDHKFETSRLAQFVAEAHLAFDHIEELREQIAGLRSQIAELRRTA